ncbi:hypothetical protein [Oceanobacillus oncorhynchi]|uniref:ATP-binding protein n=1 Tax=Oceanobacillus oncorhynchi TaxID=545501 RepID=UPI002F96B572
MSDNVLNHLKESVPSDVGRQQISYYSVALEAWRRGLTVKFYSNKRGSRYPSMAHQYSISDGVNEYYFICARGPHTNQKAIDITQNKPEAYKYYQKAGVPTPEGSVFSFDETSIDEIVKYGNSIGFPIVIKPTNMGGGKGVFTQIKSSEELRQCLIEVKDVVKSKDVMVEKYITGIDYRFFVMGNEVVGATKSYSSYVVGDGKNNIDELIKEMNKKIQRNVGHRGRTIKIDKDLLNYLETQKLTLNDIPSKNERIFLRKHGSHLGIRLNVDCTDDIDEKFKEYAVKAIQSVDGIPYGSVDMIINEEENEGVVNEINTKGEIFMHVYPMEGKARDVPKAVIDYYFPNTVRKEEKLFFEFKPIKDLFMAGLASEIVIPKLQEEKLYHQNITLQGKNLLSLFLRKIYKKAAFYRIMGTIYKTDEDTIDLNLYGTRNNLRLYSSFLENAETKKSTIKKIDAKEPVVSNDAHAISLEVKDLHNPKSKVNLK